MRRFLMLSVSLLAVNVAHANPAEDAAYNKFSKPVYDSKGNCVRTQWQGRVDPCAPAEVPKPVAVVKPAPVVVAPVPQISREQRSVYFDFNSTELNADATVKLDQLAEIINDSSEIGEVRIHGFTDQIGSTSYNGALANQRAAAVKAYLDSKSRLAATQGDIRGLGKSKPEAACKAVAKRAEKISCMNQERRVEVEFLAKE